MISLLSNYFLLAASATTTVIERWHEAAAEARVGGTAVAQLTLAGFAMRMYRTPAAESPRAAISVREHWLFVLVFSFV